MDLKAHIGARVQQARRSAGYNQDGLAAVLGRSTRSLSSIETGKALPSLQSLELIANAVGKPLTFFFPSVEVADVFDLPRVKAERELGGLLQDLTQEDLMLAIALLKALRTHRNDQC